MKKTLVLSAAALLVLAACNKEAFQPEVKVLSLTATMEQQVDPNATKTSRSDDNKVLWTTGDAIKVFDKANKYVTLTVDEGGATIAHFSQDGDTPAGYGEPSYAVYPAAAASAATSEGVITFTLPATQTYAADSFDPACNVMVGQVSGSNVTFYNTVGVLKLQLSGILRVGKIVITSKYASEHMNGTFQADATSATPTASWVSGGSNSIMLDCSANGGVQLRHDEPTAFYIVVPAGCFDEAGNSGFTAQIYDIYDSYAYSKTIGTSNPAVVNRARIRVMPESKISILPAGYTEVSYLQSSGKWIDTGVVDSDENPLYGVEYIFAVSKFGVDSYAWIWGNVINGSTQFSRHLVNDKAMTPHYNVMDMRRLPSGHNGTAVEKDTFYEVRIGDNYDGSTWGIAPGSTASDNTTNVGLFRTCAETTCGHGEHDQGVRLQFFRMLSSANTLVRYFIPCTNDSSVPGMYDRVNGVFYAGSNTATGTGVFTTSAW